MLIEASVPLMVRLTTGVVYLRPGLALEFSEVDGRKLLERAKGKVRLVALPDDVTIEPASPTARPIYWERATGITGPARPEFLAMVGKGPNAQFWVVAEFQGLPVWINSVVLRSRRQFEQQMKPRVVERIPEPR